MKGEEEEWCYVTRKYVTRLTNRQAELGKAERVEERNKHGLYSRPNK